MAIARKRRRKNYLVKAAAIDYRPKTPPPSATKKATLPEALVLQSSSTLLQLKKAIEKAVSSGNARDAHMAEIVSEEHRKKTPAQIRADRNLTLSLSALGTALIGRAVFWPLQIYTLGVLVYVGLPIYKKAFGDLKKGKVSVATLLTLVVLGAARFHFFVAGSIAVIVRQLSLRLRLRVTEDSKNKLIDVFRQQPTSVWLLIDGQEVQTSFDQVKLGDTIVVNAGEMIPIDGRIIDGMATIDQHILTGESTPVERGEGKEVFASTTVLSGRIFVEVEKTGDQTTVAKIGEMLNNTIDFRTKADLRAEMLADKTVVPTLVLGGLTLPLLGPMGAVAVLNSHFKYKMSVIAPVSIMNFLNIASHEGILIKDGRTLDLLNDVDTIVFDKTGTLTEEQPHVGAVHAVAALAEDEVLRLTASAEQRQAHPIAHAILDEAAKRGLNIAPVDEAAYKMGYGLTVLIEDKIVHVGSYRFMEVSGIEISSQIQKIQDRCHELAHSLVVVAVDNQIVGGVELLPTVRPEASRVLQTLRQRPNIKELVIISGDHETPTRRLAAELGIDRYFAQTLPQDKAGLIQQLQEEGRNVCYIGDGINDAIALKQSQVSISLRGASSVATDTAQIVLMDGRLSNLPAVFELSHKFKRNTNASFAAVVVPAMLSLGGVLFLGMGLFPTIMFNLAGLAGGMANSMLPLLTHEMTEKKESPER